MVSVDPDLDLCRLRDFRGHRRCGKRLSADAKEIVCSVVCNQRRCSAHSDGVHDVDRRRIADNGAIWCGHACIGRPVVDCLAIFLAVLQKQGMAGLVSQSVGVLRNRERDRGAQTRVATGDSAGSSGRWFEDGSMSSCDLSMASRTTSKFRFDRRCRKACGTFCRPRASTCCGKRCGLVLQNDL